MKVVVIGGSGFVGTRLVRRLLPRFSVQILDKNPSYSYNQITSLVDVRSQSDLNNSVTENSVIINLAAEHMDNVWPRSLYDEVNVIGAKNICLAARQKKINKIIFTSSVAVYGFAPIGTNESGNIQPFNDYGRTKWQAEEVYKSWQLEDPNNRTLVIVRPTVIFGELNRGNVFNLLKYIATGKFIMIGSGLNKKSVAYVENVAAFLEYSISFESGIHIYNYVDKPDLTMSQFVSYVYKFLNMRSKMYIRLPYFFGIFLGNIFDFIGYVCKIKFSISSIRIKKFCANSVYESNVHKTGFIPPVQVLDALERTIRYEFIENQKIEKIFHTE